ncbi:MAG: hypothetical protein Q9214_004991, partial [Letrouitia sp. 1 TL-2023]
VFIRNLPEQTTENQAQRYFRPILAKLNINVFHCEKHNGKNFARITVPDRQQGAIFLQNHGQSKPGREGFGQVRNKLHFRGRPINCVESTHAPDEFLLQSLQKDELAGIRPKEARGVKNQVARSKLQKSFNIIGFDCGLMDYRKIELGFVSHFQQARSGRLKFTKRCILINLDQQNQDVLAQQIEIPYNSVQSFITGSLSNPFVLFSLFEAPKLFEKVEPMTEMILRLSQMGPSMSTIKKKNDVRYRIAALAKGHEAIVATCLCYRINISSADIQNVQMLKMVPGLPKSIPWDMPNITKLPFHVQMTELNRALTDARTKLTFEVKFQFQRLALNFYLPPYKVLQLTKVVQQPSVAFDASIFADAVRRLSYQLPFAGADADAIELSVESIYKLLQQNEQSITQERHFSRDIVAEYDHIAYIHKATVTPAGIYLEGPMPEVKNRVLRKYSSFTSYFLQVSFVDEDGETLRYDRSTSLERIFHVRFKKVLEGIINIAGRPYEFLGFSHSSLRAQTCWFMAPFILNGHLRYARMVIKDLGDFSAIRSPAKCAARIGQAFSQTFSSVALSRSAFREIPDVKRNNRVFSDGVGTCSKSVLQKIWKAYAQSRVYKPTVCQIRYAGAKGMISLDSRLQGEALCLRRSMIKFEAPNDTDIEICGAGFKPLPLYLNRPLIKILEDLGVPDWSFVYLQAEAVEQLRITTLNPVNAAYFLQRNLIGKAARLSWLIRKLSYIGMSFQDDHFLRSVLELAVLIQLKELKYRSRIYVENGMTVYGIMDETDFLEEGQIYCSVQNEKSGMVLTGRVVITRNPALHPGDIQCVDAVDAPEGSPLRDVHNCVVFSSKGKRDLPSQLSGGDLDGDLYNIIYDNDLFPQRTCEPADYAIEPPLDIGREVTRSDMTDFFILFMENDQLG